MSPLCVWFKYVITLCQVKYCHHCVSYLSMSSLCVWFKYVTTVSDLNMSSLCVRLKYVITVCQVEVCHHCVRFKICHHCQVEVYHHCVSGLSISPLCVRFMSSLCIMFKYVITVCHV
jgi:hypothetical protein